MATCAHFADRDPLTKVVLEQMLARVRTRRFARTREPVGPDVIDRERSATKRVCVELLADLVERGLDCDQGVLVVLDGGKALGAAVDAVFGPARATVRPPLCRLAGYADACGNWLRCGGSRAVEVGIIRSLRGTRGARRVAGSGRLACSAGSSSRARLL